MTEYDSPFSSVMWRKGEARLRSFATASRAKATVITLTVEITGDGYALADILRQCHEAQREGQPSKPATPNPRSKKGADAAQQRSNAPLSSLPAPPLSLPYFGDDT